MEYKEFESDMKKAIDYLETTLSEIRAGRANPGILNNVMVDYYGVSTPINQIASISVPEAKVILVQPWDAGMLKHIERAIIEANVGITPQNDGKVIRLVFPDLTEERRKELSKEVKSISEDAKVRIRNARRDAIDHAKKLEKDKEISEDDLKKAEESIQKLTDKYSSSVDEISDKKQKEIMTV